MIVPLTQTSQRPLPRLEPAPRLPQWHTIAGAEAAACRGQVIPDYDEFKQWKEAGGQSAFDADKVPPSTRILGLFDVLPAGHRADWPTRRLGAVRNLLFFPPLVHGVPFSRLS